MAAANGGDNVPSLNTRFDRSAFDDGALVTFTVYVFIVVPSCAVTTVVIILPPTARGIDPDGLPLATGVPFTVIVAVGSAAVGVSVIEVTLFATDAV